MPRVREIPKGVRWCKLDTYDYHIDAPNIPTMPCKIFIKVENNNDVRIADIATDINGADGFIYLEGRRFKYITCNVEDQNDKTYLKILARELRR